MSRTTPDPAAVRSQLGALMAGAAFRDSERHRRLLEFLVETTLRGEAEGLKEFVIAAEVWGRDVSCDPRIHSTVRVEVGRLRARLARHYAGEGSRDAIRFRVPTGGYAVVIEQGDSSAPLPVEVPSDSGTSVDGGHFETIELIGRGGMGEVWKARDRRLGRDVALKFISKELAKNRIARERFEREARAAASLNHPNICTVYDVGETGGQPFLAMELLVGETLEHRLAASAVPVEALIDWGIEIADALEAAHAQGIVHSDLKPANLFLTARGQTKILDFGLARLMGNSGTEPKAAAGTPGYMSPEQMRGEELDPRSDIYSLGIVLYRAATGRLPAATPGPPSSLNPLISQDLDRIIAKALEGDREVRYQHASELRADLKRVKRDSDAGLYRAATEPVIASRRRVWWPGLALLGLLVVAASVAGVEIYRHFRVEKRTPFLDFSITRMTDSEDVQLTAISPDGKYLVTARRDAEGGQSLWVHHLPSSSDRKLLEKREFRILRIVVSPDSSYIYFRAEQPMTGTAPGGSDIFRIPMIGGEPVRVAGNADSQLSFFGGGQRLCFYRGHGTPKTYEFMSANADGGDEKVLARGGDPLPSVSVCSPDGQRAAMTFHGGEVDILDFATGRKSVLYHSENEHGMVYDVNWDPDGKGLIVSLATNGNYILQLGYLSYPSGDFHRITNNLNTYLHGVSLSADGRTMAATEGRQESKFYLVPIGQPNTAELAPFHWIESFAWLDDGRLLAAGADSTLKLVALDGSESEALNVPKGHFFAEPAGCGRGSVVAAGGSRDDQTQGIFRLSLAGGGFQQLTRGKADISPECTPDGQWLLYLDSGVVNQSRLMRMPMAGGNPQFVGSSGAFDVSPDGKLVALVEYEKVIPVLALVSTETWRETARIRLSIPVDRNIRFTADSRSVLMVSNRASSTSIWRQPLDGSPAQQVLTLAGRHIPFMSPSPDGSRIGFAAYTSPADAVIFQDKSR